MAKSTIEQYKCKLQQLHQLFIKGTDGTPEADRIREEMDPLWDAMNTKERDDMRKYYIRLGRKYRD